MYEHVCATVCFVRPQARDPVYLVPETQPVYIGLPSYSVLRAGQGTGYLDTTNPPGYIPVPSVLLLTIMTDRAVRVWVCTACLFG